MSPTLVPELRKRRCSEVGAVQNLGTLPYSPLALICNAQQWDVLDGATVCHNCLTLPR